MSDLKKLIVITLQGYIDGDIEFNDTVNELAEIVTESKEASEHISHTPYVYDVGELIEKLEKASEHTSHTPYVYDVGGYDKKTLVVDGKVNYEQAKIIAEYLES